MIDPSLAESLITVRGLFLVEKYTFCSTASTERLFKLDKNANEVSQFSDPDASTFLTAE